MKIGTKLYSIVALMTLLVVAVWGVGFYAAKISHESLTTVYNDRVVCLEQLKVISDMYAVNIVDTTHKTRDGAISWRGARQNVAEAQKKIADKWKDYLATHLDPEEKKLVDETFPLMKKADEAVARLNALLEKEDIEELKKFAAMQLYPAMDPLTKKIASLIEIQLVVAKQDFYKSEFYYHKGKLFSICLIIIGLFISGWLALVIIKRLLIDLGGEPSCVREIALSVAEGDLKPVVVDQDKKGSVLWAMKIMVVKLNDLIFEKDNKNRQLGNMAEELDAQVAELEATLDQVKQLEGIIPICMYCKKIRDDQESWHRLEDYISKHSEAKFSHGACPDCYKEQMNIIRNLKL